MFLIFIGPLLSSSCVLLSAEDAQVWSHEHAVAGLIDAACEAVSGCYDTAGPSVSECREQSEAAATAWSDCEIDDADLDDCAAAFRAYGNSCDDDELVGTQDACEMLEDCDGR